MDSAETKVYAMIALGLGSMAVGMLPAWLYRGQIGNPQGSGSLLRSALLCFGAGVLLATSLMHMLPEARETFPQYAELSFCGGFFLIYLIDELVHALYGRGTNDRDNGDRSTSTAGHSHNHHQDTPHQHSSNPNQSYGAVETTNLLIGDQPVAGGCHTVQQEPCTESSVGRGGLLVALSTHALLEGLAIGLEDQPYKVLMLLGAVASHKLVFGFCLGTELTVSRSFTLTKYTTAISIFSLGSVCGIGVGMVIEGSDEYWTQSALGAMQALAGGTLLYVTLSEVLPRERARWHDGVRFVGFLQFFAVMTGFSVIYLINRYLDADRSLNYIN